MESIYDAKGIDEFHVALVGNKVDLEHFRKGSLKVKFSCQKLAFVQDNKFKA